MDWIHALILGLIQGITEFFPISSSAHLKIGKAIFGVSIGTGDSFFDLSCHLGTFLVLVIYFRRELFYLLFRDQRCVLPFIVALLPLFPLYWLLKPVSYLFSGPEYLGFCLMGTGGILFISSVIFNRNQVKKELSLKDALWIGFFQALSLLPGISRSAITIGAALWRGLPASKAVQFSFLLSLPTIFGGIFIELLNTQQKMVPLTHCFIGFFAASITGFGIINFAIPLLEKGVFKPFSRYCIIIGVLLIMYSIYL